MILVSACLLGCRVKYNGGDNRDERLAAAKDTVISACAEVLGGLLIPRVPAEIVGGSGEDVLDGRARVIDREGIDRTEEFVRGAYCVLDIAKANHVTAAILKEGSPSCGSSRIYDGTFSGVKIAGEGVTASLLRRNGITVCSEETLTKERLEELLREENGHAQSV